MMIPTRNEMPASTVTKMPSASRASPRRNCNVESSLKIDHAIDRLFTRYKAPKPKRLYTVTENRVKVRQLPGSI